MEAVEELPTGFALRFASDAPLFLNLAEFVTSESACCSFLHFTLKQEPAGGSVWLRLTGPVGVKDFLRLDLPILASV